MALSNQTHIQRTRLLEELRRRPITTFEARTLLDIPHPAGRVRELRRKHNIMTCWVTDNGHRIARYVLLAGENA